MMFRLIACFFLMFYGTSTVQAQSLYLRTYQTHIQQDTYQLSLANGDIIVAGNIVDSGSLQKNNLMISRLNSCGDIIWSKQYANDSASLDVVGLELGTNNNILIAGNYHLAEGRNLFLMSINFNGGLNYLKRYKTGTADIAYSMDLSPAKEIYLFFNANVGEAGPNNKLSLIKLDQNANLLWYKTVGFSWIWGQMSATSDGGVLISNNMEIFKMDAAGNIPWAKSFSRIDYSKHHFEVPSGYAFFKNNPSQNFAYPLMINKNGSLKWIGQRIPNFQAQKGILRSNGNLLYLGKLSLPGLAGSKLSFVEIDTSNGNIIETNLPYHQLSLNFTAYNLFENQDSTISFSGYENLSLQGGLLMGKISKDLNSMACVDTVVSLNFPIDTLTLVPEGTRIVSNANILVEEPSIQISNYSLLSPSYFCAYKTALSLDLGEDTVLCPRQSLLLQSTSMEFDYYLWSTGHRGKSIVVDTAGTYWLRGILDCDTITDSINVAFRTVPEFDLGPDTSICLGSNIILDANGHLAIWSTGETALSIVIAKAGEYWAEVPSICGPIRDSIHIDLIPELKKPDLGKDTVLCFAASLHLNPGSDYDSIKWSTNESTPTIEVKKSGLYFVAVYNFCDTLMDSIQVDFLPELIIDATVEPMIAKVLDSIEFIHIEPQVISKLLWEFGDGSSSTSSASVHQYSSAGTYTATMTVTDKYNCSASKYFEILIKNHEYVIPNVFTPNGDGINDEFGVFGQGISNIKIEIYSRWGNRIYTSNSFWDGKSMAGDFLPNGVYFYVLSFQQIGRDPIKLNGEVSLLR